MAVTPTILNSENQIYLAGVDIQLRLHNLNMDTSLQLAIMDLYIWSGDLDTPPTAPLHRFKSKKVSAKDNYINFEISKQITAEINKTRFVWNSGENAPMVRGEGVFFQIKYQIDEETPVELPTCFATNGYRFDFEQVGDISGAIDGQPYLGLLPINYTDRNFSENIKYYRREFDFTKTLGTCTSENIIKSTAVTPTTSQCQKGGKYLVAYLNRHGLFDYFTPFGKATKQIKVDAETNIRLYRNPKSINNSVVHSKRRSIDTTEQTYTLNTGYLTEAMVEQIEEVIYSPLVYLINFSGATFDVSQIGVTVDSTLITVDSTLYTVDNTVITANDVGYYSDYKQIPVTNENNDFMFKTRQFDKGKINYDLTFKSTTDKINNVR